MSDCPACGATVRPDLEECENCGNPVAAAAPARRTVLGDEAPPASGGGLYRPPGRAPRRTQLDDADPFASALGASGASRPKLDPTDPFAAAASGSSPRSGRRTMIDAPLPRTSKPAVSPDDPFARALEPATATSPWPPLARPLVGLFITFSGATNGRILPLTQGRTDVGRDPGPPGPEVLILDDDSVSSTHALITAQPGVIWFEDNRSSNGTKVKSLGESAFRMLPPGVPSQLRHGDIVQMGDSVLQFRMIDRESVKEIWGS